MEKIFKEEENSEIDGIFLSKAFEKAREVARQNPPEKNQRFNDRKQIISNECIVFPVTDLSPFLRYYYLILLKKRGIVLGLTNESRVHYKEGWLLLLDPDKTPNLEMSLTNRILYDPPYSTQLISFNERLLEDISNKLEEAKRKILTEEELHEIFDRITSYCSMPVDKLINFDIPYSILTKRTDLTEERRVQVLNNFLCPSTPTYYYIFYQQLLNLASETLLHGFSRSAAEDVAERVGYLERRDVKPCRLEDIDYLKGLVENHLMNNGNLDKIKDEKMSLYIGQIRTRTLKSKAYEILMGCLKGTDEKIAQEKRYLDFISTAIEHNETGRMVRTLLLKILERWLLANGLNPMTSEVPEIFYKKEPMNVRIDTY